MYRALIVEDEDLMREYLASKLAELCPEWESAATATDGMEAVERLAHEHFDAVLTDIRMPGMDGLELARYIRRTDAEMPILILSGYDEFNYARAAMRLNVFDYLLKPLNEQELSAALSAMAVLAASRRNADTTGMVSRALEGDARALEELRCALEGKACGLLLLAPALTMPEPAREAAFFQLYQTACVGFSTHCARLKHAVALLCPAPDPLLVETECRSVANRITQLPTELCPRFGFATFDPDRARASAAGGESALRLALALNEPWVADPLLFTQRQALARLDAMLTELNRAVEEQTLSEQRRASLLATLREFPACAGLTLVRSLLMDCDAEEAVRTEALEVIQAEPATFSNGMGNG